MLQQNDNGVTLTWLKRTLFKCDSPAYMPHKSAKSSHSAFTPTHHMRTKLRQEV